MKDILAWERRKRARELSKGEREGERILLVQIRLLSSEKIAALFNSDCFFHGQDLYKAG